MYYVAPIPSSGSKTHTYARTLVIVEVWVRLCSCVCLGVCSRVCLGVCLGVCSRVCLGVCTVCTEQPKGEPVGTEGDPNGET